MSCTFLQFEKNKFEVHLYISHELPVFIVAACNAEI